MSRYSLIATDLDGTLLASDKDDSFAGVGFTFLTFRDYNELMFLQEGLLMDIYKEIDLLDCPICGGPALLEEENGWCFYVTCLDCGCHTAEVGYKTEDERLDTAKKAASLWHRGKVIAGNPGE